MLRILNKKHKKRKFKITTRGKSYSVKDSWLYNIRTKKKLCSKLEITIEELNTLTEDETNYHLFLLDKKGGGNREIQAPKFNLDKIHSRIASLLARIKLPEYLHSGVKGRSNISNAKMHLGEIPVLTIDIKRFYPSTSQKSIYHFFCSNLNCAPDVAGLLAALCTYNKHIPTGSRLSMILAFWANKPMFDHLHRLCVKKNITMSVYVDDLTFSGKNVTQVFLKNVIDIIENSGMSAHPKKIKLFPEFQPKIITGVVIKGNTISVRNKHYKAIHEIFNSINGAKDEAELYNLRCQLLGRLNAAGQIDPRFRQLSYNLRNS